MSERGYKLGLVAVWLAAAVATLALGDGEGAAGLLVVAFCVMVFA